MTKLNIETIDDKEWHPTEPVISETPAATDAEESDGSADDVLSVISISSEDSELGSITSITMVSVSEVEPFVNSGSEMQVENSEENLPEN